MLPSVTPALEGTNAMLQCSPMMTVPTPSIIWLVNGSNSGVTTENFTVSPVNETADTVYQCLVEATFVPTTHSVGLPPLTSLITTTVVDCKAFPVLYACIGAV